MEKHKRGLRNVGVIAAFAGTLLHAACSSNSGETSGGKTETTAPAKTVATSTHAPGAAPKSCIYELQEPFFSQANVAVLHAGAVALTHEHTDKDRLPLKKPGTYDLTAYKSTGAKEFDTSPDQLHDWANWVNDVELGDGGKLTLYNDDGNTNPGIAAPQGLHITIECHNSIVTTS